MGILPAAQRIVNRFYARRVAHFAVCLTCTAPTLTLPHQAMSFFPSHLSGNHARNSIQECSPVEIVDSHLKRLEALHPKLNTFVHLNGEGARRQSRVAESWCCARAPRALHGVRLLSRAALTSRLACPAVSAPQRLCRQSGRSAGLAIKAAGAILLGNTNTPEFLMAYEPTTDSPEKQATLELGTLRGRLERR